MASAVRLLRHISLLQSESALSRCLKEQDVGKSIVTIEDCPYPTGLVVEWLALGVPRQCSDGDLEHL